MKKINVVKESKDFQKIITTGICKKDKNLVIYYKDNDFNRYRFGISVGKKIGNAVTRNHYKRKIRNIIDHNKKLYSNTTDYIIIVRRNCLEIDYEALETSFIKLIQSSKKGERYESKK